MATTGQLNGLRVVSLAVNLPGPLAAARLAGFGATVTKVEPPAGDPLAAVLPRWYAELTEGQQVMTLDLKDRRGRERLDVELADADVLITSHRPSALRRLDLNGVHLRFPGLTHVEIVGHAGDDAEAPGHDLTYQAVHGTLTPPVMPTVPVADMLGAERAVTAALLGIAECRKAGAGQHYRVILDEAAAFAGAAVRHGLTGEGAPLGGANPAYRIYRTADGHIALGALEPHFWARTCELLDVSGSGDELERVFRTRSTADWEALARQADIPLAGIRAHR